MSCPNCIRPIYGENYDLHWSNMDYRGKRVIDVGADVGSTADYFISKGAILVYAVEGDVEYFKQLQENAKTRPQIQPIFLLIASPTSLENLIIDNPTDIIKMDCERCEIYLSQVDDNILKIVPEYIIEAHTQQIFDLLADKFFGAGFQVYHFSYAHVTMLIARRF